MYCYHCRVHGECLSATTTVNMISSRSLAFFALMAVVGFALAMPQPEAEAEAEAQRFYGNNYYSSNYGYPSYYRGYSSGYGNNGFYGNNYNNYNNYHGNSGNRGFYNGNSGFW